jgi:predicted transcriptional regulator of viral defense system
MGLPMTETVVKSVKSRIIKQGRGWCFTPKHFLDLDSDTGVRSALSRLQKDKFIRRLAQGIYEYPRVHTELGVLPPNVEAIAKAIAEKNGIKIQPSGAYAANLIGLSEQVPGRVVFLTNGPSKKIKVGKREIIFRTTTEKNMHTVSTKVSLVVQAFRHLGKDNIDKTACKRTQKFLEDVSGRDMVRDLKYAPQWIRVIIFNIMGIVS